MCVKNYTARNYDMFEYGKYLIITILSFKINFATFKSRYIQKKNLLYCVTTVLKSYYYCVSFVWECYWNLLWIFFQNVIVLNAPLNKKKKLYF